MIPSTTWPRSRFQKKKQRKALSPVSILLSQSLSTSLYLSRPSSHNTSLSLISVPLSHTNPTTEWTTTTEKHLPLKSLSSISNRKKSTTTKKNEHHHGISQSQTWNTTNMNKLLEEKMITYSECYRKWVGALVEGWSCVIEAFTSGVEKLRANVCCSKNFSDALKRWLQIGF